MQPKFLRFPGGNYVEGNTIAERFNWKETIGDVSQRPGHRSPWGYWSTDGFGLLEFLEWCEDLKMEPVLAVYAGYSLRQQHIDPGTNLDSFVQDALDEIEYVTGDANTKWGAQRVKDGHSKPFPLRYVEVGNEDFFDRSGSYEGRFAQFYDAIKAKYPNLQVIATTPVKSRVPDLVDEHYYRSQEDMQAHALDYDKYSRTNKTKIFVGEWATRVGSPTPNMAGALGDAAWMTGMERNSDIVLMECYAPLFVNVSQLTGGGRSMQWATDLIGYDALTQLRVAGVLRAKDVQRDAWRSNSCYRFSKYSDANLAAPGAARSYTTAPADSGGVFQRDARQQERDDLSEGGEHRRSSPAGQHSNQRFGQSSTQGGTGDAGCNRHKRHEFDSATRQGGSAHRKDGWLERQLYP